MRVLGAGLLAIGAIAVGFNFVRQRADPAAPHRNSLPLPAPPTESVHLEAIRSAGL